MSIERLLVANRGEIAVRILRAAAELGIPTLAIHSEDDARALHVSRADRAAALGRKGAAAYLDMARVIALAREHGCDAVHPGYGFLSEQAEFARACEKAGIAFIGPRPETLELLGDKTRALSLAREAGVPVVQGTEGAVDAAGARALFEALPDGAAMVIKAVAGGGGRGMRIVRSAGEVEEAHARCSSEAAAAFGDGAVYAERLIERARHVEVQVVGDGQGGISHVWERECSLQRRHQKLVELAPSPHLPQDLRDKLLAAATTLAAKANLRSLATIEFLVDSQTEGSFAFIEANPRLQVEHTVTEEVTGIDLVATQLQLAGGATLAQLGLEQASISPPRGHAIQLRVNMETMDAEGQTRPSGGTLTRFQVPSGPGLRVDTFGYVGYTTSPAFDSLLAKVIAHSPAPTFESAVAKAYRALGEFEIGGVSTNLGLLQSLLARDELKAGTVYTRFVEDHVGELVQGASEHRRLFFGDAPERGPAARGGQAGVKLGTDDPLAVLDHGQTPGGSAASPGMPPEAPPPESEGPPGTTAVRAPMQGTIVSLDVTAGDAVTADLPLLVMEAMKMEHVIAAPCSGIVREVGIQAGDTIFEGHALVFIEEGEVEGTATGTEEEVDLERIRPDLAEVIQRHAYGLDENRQEAVAKRHGRGHRTARENVDDLVDPGTYVEYGSLVIAAQRRRRNEQDLIERTPADGLIAGIGRVNGELFGDEGTRCMVISYDYMVLAGTQGQQNHRKKDRMFELAEQSRLPIIFFTEGGGGRPGDTDALGVSGLDCLAFNYYGRLSGLVPLVGIANGRCFAGNAALLGCSDVVIATRSSTIGMGGPAMIEGVGLGVFTPEEVGPIESQLASGVVDIAVEDEAEAVRVAKRYIGYFQGTRREWSCPDQRLLRSAIPENRLRVYDVRKVIETLADDDSVLEVRRHFGPGMVTALMRIEGRPLGVIANNPTHLAGAIDSDGADKAARFMQLCDAHDLPILMLCDTPGIMVGPEAERTGLVRHASRLFVTGASLSVPFFTIVLRKGYGLGAQTMAGGSFKTPFFTIAWPTSELGGMGLEGAVKLGFRKELAAIEDPAERKETFDKMVEAAYRHGRGVNVASHFELDDVIDPADSRLWIMSALQSWAPRPLRDGKKRPCIDTW